MKVENYIHTFCLFSLVSLVTSCASFDTLLKKKPKITVQKVTIRSISVKKITLLTDVTIENPYPFAIKLEKIGSTVFINKNKLFKTVSNKKFSIKKQAKASNQFLVTLTYKSVGRAVKDYLTNDNITCTIDSLFTFKLPDVPGFPATAEVSVTAHKKIPPLKEVIKKSSKKFF